MDYLLQITYYDLWMDIFSLLNIRSKLAIRFICHDFLENFFISDTFDIRVSMFNKLNTKMMCQLCHNIRFKSFHYSDPFKKFIDFQGTRFTNYLKILYANSKDSGFNDHNIRGLDLVELHTDNNPFISDISHMKNLKILSATEHFGDCGISDWSIQGLDLIELSVDYNNKVTNVSFMHNLRKLSASGNCGVDNVGIQGLNLIELNVGNNPKITNISFIYNLKILYAYENSGIDDAGIYGLDLIELNARDNPKITNVTFMKNLKILFACGNCGIGNAGIAGLNIKEIYPAGNSSLREAS